MEYIHRLRHLFIIFLSTGFLFAQTTGAFRAKVLDPSGASVAKAAITIARSDLTIRIRRSRYMSVA